ncbi:JAB domain-containing protein [bacterium]|nr:JAB domain-containing protein [bacterium]
MVKIKDIPTSDRPIERLIQKGSDSLSNEELLAILIRTGTKGKSSKELASNILSSIKNIQELKNLNFKQLTQIDGIGPSKAAILLSTIELSKRMNQTVHTIIKKKGNNPAFIFEYYQSILQDKTQEYFYAIYLDQAKTIIQDKLLFIGTINYSLVHPRDIFKEAYLLSASSIIIVHNHPTGNVLPSQNDIDTTNNLVKVGSLLGIKVIDHIIIGSHHYYSFFENGCIE